MFIDACNLRRLRSEAIPRYEAISCIFPSGENDSSEPEDNIMSSSGGTLGSTNCGPRNLLPLLSLLSAAPR